MSFYGQSPRENQYEFVDSLLSNNGMYVEEELRVLKRTRLANKQKRYRLASVLSKTMAR